MRRNGFTLIELMVSAALSLVILGVVTFAFSNASGVVKKAMAMSDRIDRAQTAARQFEADFDHLLTGNAGLWAAGGATGTPRLLWNANPPLTDPDHDPDHVADSMNLILRFNTYGGRDKIFNDYDAAPNFENAYDTITYRVNLESGPGGGTSTYVRWVLTRESAAAGTGQIVLSATPWFPRNKRTQAEVLRFHPLQVGVTYFSRATEEWVTIPASLTGGATGNFLDLADVDAAGPAMLTLTWSQADIAFNPANKVGPDVLSRVDSGAFLSPAMYVTSDDNDYLIQNEIRITQTYQIQPSAELP